jgi:tetratricopeptide (TPR) repeat protein
MKRCLGLFLFLLLHVTAHAQQVSNLNFTALKADVTDAKSPFYLPTLLSRFQKADSTLTDDDYMHLYYGQVTADFYSPYASTDEAFRKAYKEEKFKQAIELGEKALKQQPLSLDILFKLLVCYDQLGDKATARQYARRYFSLIRVITASGDGKSLETAYVVTAVHDEYEVLATLDLRSSGQALIGHTDRLTVSSTTEKDSKEYPMYFDVSQPFSHLAQQFKKK